MRKENHTITLWSLALILAASGQAQAQTAPKSGSNTATPIVGQAVQRHMLAPEVKTQEVRTDVETASTPLPSTQSTDKHQVTENKDAPNADSTKLDAVTTTSATASEAVNVVAESLESAPPIVQPSPLRLLMGQRLSTTLRSWLQDRGMSLSWEAQGSMPGRMRDVSLTRDWVSSSTDLARTLAEALAPFGLSADIVQSSQTVVVRNSTAAQAAPAIQ